MPFPRPTLSELQQTVNNDIAAALPTGTPLTRSYLRQLSLTQAGFAHMHNGYLDWVARMSVPFTAEGEYLYAWGKLKNVLPKFATAAKGAILVTGVSGSVIPAGTIYKRSDGVTYSTDSANSIPIANLTVLSVTATSVGDIGNGASGNVLTLNASIAGVSNTGTVLASGLVGGSDDESYDDYRGRVLAAYAKPAQGGSVNDYVRWALEVPGVTRAWLKPNAAGGNSVTVFFMMDDAQAANNGFPQGPTSVAFSETRAPSYPGDPQNVANYIYPLRPASTLVYAAAPAAQAINVTIANLNPSTTAIKDAITAALKDMLKQKGTPLISTLYMSDFTDAVSSVPGVVGFTLSTPSTSISTALGSIPTLGTLSWT